MTEQKKAAVLNPDKFAEYLGLATWLSSMSKDHKSKAISDIDKQILPAILLKQFQVVRDQKFPIAFILWASVSEEIERKIDLGEEDLEIGDWRSGSKVVVVDCIAPFGHRERIISEFLAKKSDRGDLK